ncbi:AEC family transporter [Pantanalinema rosaneae CENA516]|uniref:AEC family transporter n=1 Tax=Pantanalinema rosaneae TaxID=1620701 RepID=UPI003D6ED8FB
MSIVNLLTIYTPLVGWTGVGWLLGRWLPKSTPVYLGKFLFRFGVPLGIFAFLRHTQISWSLWLAPVTAWSAIALGAGLSAIALRWWRPQLQTQPGWNQRTQGSFVLATMFGNTGYIGFPVSLTLVGTEYFAWALFYDLLGSTLGAYGLGVALAARFSDRPHHPGQAFQALLRNPALGSFGVGLICRDVPLPAIVETALQGVAWGAISLSLVLVGMRLSQLTSLKKLRTALISVNIKMLLVPLILGTGLWLLGVTGLEHRVILLQMAMPPAFATLVIAEAYELDQELAVTAIAIGCLELLILLPIWLWLFSG